MQPQAPVRLPVLFLGHGSPMNAIEDNRWSRGFRAIGEGLPEYRAVLAISAHWCLAGSFLTAAAEPETIHDFGGFPPELYEVRYPAMGDAALVRRVVELLKQEQAAPRSDWGLDHGTWSVLRHLRPAADRPVVQLSIDARAKPERMIAIGRALAPLREEGILLLASGNVVHNLGDALGRMSRGDQSTPPWAAQFDTQVALALEGHDEAFLAGAVAGELGRRAHPGPDHYWPLLYALGAALPEDEVHFPLSGFDLGSLSMRCVRFG